MIVSKRALQVVVVLGALIPVSTGTAGVLFGPGILDLGHPWPTDLDSHFRFLSAIFTAIGLGFWSCVPRIEHKTRRFRLLGTLIVCGGLGRLLSLFVAGAPAHGHLAGLGMELIVVPLLLLCQSRLAPDR